MKDQFTCAISFNQVLTLYAKISLNRNINFLTKFKQKNNLTEKTKLNFK